MSTKDEGLTVSPNGQQTDVSRRYLVLYENNPDRISGSIEKFDGEVMSAENFEANKSEDFATMKKWALKNGKNIFPPHMGCITYTARLQHTGHYQTK